MQRNCLLLIAALWLASCQSSAPLPEAGSAAWTQWVEHELVTSDGQGHGPDPGSDEWQSVVEFHLGIRGSPTTPARHEAAWFRVVEERLIARREAAYLALQGEVPRRGPFLFQCEGNPAWQLTLSFVQTEPPLLLAERDNAQFLLYPLPAASGSRYRGPELSFWEHQGEARVQWLGEMTETRCLRQD